MIRVDNKLHELLDKCAVCGNTMATTEGHRPGCPRDNSITVEMSHGSVRIVTSEALGNNQSFEFDEADEWYAAEVERLKERAPA